MENNNSIFTPELINEINKKINDAFTNEELIMLGSMATTYGVENVQNIVKKLCKVSVETALSVINKK